MSHDGSHDRHGKVVHRPCNSCISSVRKSNRNSIEFSLSIAEQRAVGFILAWSLAFLQVSSHSLLTYIYYVRETERGMMPADSELTKQLSSHTLLKNSIKFK